MFYGGSVSPPRQPANKKRVVPRRSATATTMASGDEKTPPGSPKKPFGGKGGEDAESRGKGEIVRVVILCFSVFLCVTTDTNFQFSLHSNF